MFFPINLRTIDVGKIKFTKIPLLRNARKRLKLLDKVIRNLPGGGGYLTREVTGVCGKSLHTLYPVA